jgi:hypothetical protein
MGASLGRPIGSITKPAGAVLDLLTFLGEVYVEAENIGPWSLLAHGKAGTGAVVHAADQS